jgi:hypothetical protein
MSIGKLYPLGDEKTGISVDYQLHGDTGAKWWGDFISISYSTINDKVRYIIELEDGRRGLCAIHKEVGRAATGTPTRYRYSFKGVGNLDRPKE